MFENETGFAPRVQTYRISADQVPTSSWYGQFTLNPLYIEFYRLNQFNTIVVFGVFELKFPQGICTYIAPIEKYGSYRFFCVYLPLPKRIIQLPDNCVFIVIS